MNSPVKIKENLTVTVIQPDIVWEDRDTNLENYSKIIGNTEVTDLIILPEMFTTGFSMNPEKLKENENGPAVNWMKKIAGEKNSAVTGSLIIEENKQIFNRAIWVLPDGTISRYDKRHLFTMGNEHKHYSAGRERLTVEYRGWKICPLICYDLRFPVWSRNTGNYDILIYLANWPAARQQVWKNLLVARAIENQSYCIGVNRTGTDGEGIKYSGNSAFIDAKGDALFMGEDEEVRSFNLSYSELKKFRKKFPVLNDRDRFTVKV